MQNSPKKYCTLDLAKKQPCKSKISDFLGIITCENINANKNSQIITKKTIFNLPSLFLKFKYISQYNNLSCSYVYKNLFFFPTSRTITTKLGLVIMHILVNNFVNVTMSFSSRSTSKNNIKYFLIVILFFSNCNASKNIIIYTLIAIAQFSCHGTSKNIIMYTLIATTYFSNRNTSKNIIIYSSIATMSILSKISS